MQGLQAEAGKPLGRICAPGRAAEAPPPPPAAGTPPWHLCFSSRVRRTLALSSGRIWSDTIIVSTTRCAMPGRVVCSRSRRAAPGGIVREGGGTVPSDREKKKLTPSSLAPQGPANVLGEPSTQCAQVDTQFYGATAQPERDAKRSTGVRAQPLLTQRGSQLLVDCMWTDTHCASGTVPGSGAWPRPSELTAAQAAGPHSAQSGHQTSPGPRAPGSSPHPSPRLSSGVCEEGMQCPGQAGRAPTVGNGPPELQQAAEGERGHMGLSPALRLFLHVLLKLDPSGRLPPVGLLAAVQHQLVQLHKHLGWEPRVRAWGPLGGTSCPGDVAAGQAGREAGRRGWRKPKALPLGVRYLMRPPVQLLLLLLPAQDGGQAAGAAPPALRPRRLLYQMPPHPRVILQPVTCGEGGLGSPGTPAQGLRVTGSPCSTAQPVYLEKPQSPGGHADKTTSSSMAISQIKRLRPTEGKGQVQRHTGHPWQSHRKKAAPHLCPQPRPWPLPLTLPHHEPQ